MLCGVRLADLWLEMPQAIELKKNYFRAGKAQNFSKGIAQFGTGDTIVYEHYDYEKYGTDVLIGGEEVSNTFSIPSIENFSISRIKNDSNTKMFMIELGNDVHWEDGYVIFGKNEPFSKKRTEKA